MITLFAKSQSYQKSIVYLLVLITWFTPLGAQGAAPAKDFCNNNDLGTLEAPLPGLEGKTVNQIACQDSPILTYVNLIIRVITGVIVIIALIMTVIGGYIYMTAGGDGKQVEKAKTIIGGALLGVILALTAFLILNTISPQFASQIKEPTLVPGGP